MKELKISIDGREIQVKEGSSVLDAALDAGIYIPHLCRHPDLEAKGGCRLCSVEIAGEQEPVPACTTVVQEGMLISICGEKAERVRKASMELILATHPADCTGCPKYGKCELQSLYQYMGVGPERWRTQSRVVQNNDSNPLIQHLFTRCVRCGRCIRACHELRGANVLEYVKTDNGIHAGVPDGKSLADAGCRFCGACIEVCPTGSIMDATGLIKEDCSYADSIIPCRKGCPSHVDIPRYLRFIKEGKFSQAVAMIRETVPFPQLLGMICTHACEDGCKRGVLNEAISICRLKLAASVKEDESWKKKRRINAPTGKKSAVVGAGPAGLTAAYYLAKQGHDVTVFEKNEKAGGQCRYGIPAYRLPDEVLDKEIADILEVGVKLKTTCVCNSPAQLLNEGYDTVLVATGTHQGIKLPLSGNHLDGVWINTDFLKQARENKLRNLGECVVVLGGGNVAYDCARTALRLGAKRAHIICLEARENMMASLDEIAEGEEEGVVLHDSSSFLRIVGEERAEGVQLQKVNSFSFDEAGKACLHLAEGTEETIRADTVVFAVGQRPQQIEEWGMSLTGKGYISVEPDMGTSLPGIYAAGDVVTGTRSVIEAIAAGRSCAIAMDKYMGGDGDIAETLAEKQASNPHLGECPGFAAMQRACVERKEAQARIRNFDWIEIPFSDTVARREASRCLQCDLRLDISVPKLWNEY